MTSTRLPGKVLLPAGQKPLFSYHINRLRASGLPVYVATTTNKEDNPLVAWCEDNHVGFYRGEEHDVLDRFYRCAEKFELQTIVRVTSDCPLIDGRLVGKAVQQYQELQNPRAYLSNVLKRSFPRGLDFEIFSMNLLREAWQHARQPVEREHVTPYIYKNGGGHVRLEHYVRQAANASQYRITVDTEADYQLVKTLIEAHQAHHLNAEQLVWLLEDHPELVALNAHVEQKKLGQ